MRVTQGLFAIAAMVGLAAATHVATASEPPAAGDVTLSGRQKMLLKFYGFPPPAFTVTFLPDPVGDTPRRIRHELWTYPHRKATYEFYDGRYSGSRAESSGDPDAKGPARLRPEQIRDGMILKDLESLLGRKPGKSTRPKDPEGAGGVLHDWGGGIIAVCLERGDVVQVEVSVPPKPR